MSPTESPTPNPIPKSGPSQGPHPNPPAGPSDMVQDAIDKIRARADTLAGWWEDHHVLLNDYHVSATPYPNGDLVVHIWHKKNDNTRLDTRTLFALITHTGTRWHAFRHWAMDYYIMETRLPEGICFVVETCWTHEVPEDRPSMLEVL